MHEEVSGVRHTNSSLYTSRTAPAMLLDRNAVSRACWSTTSPRATLISTCDEW